MTELDRVASVLDLKPQMAVERYAAALQIGEERLGGEGEVGDPEGRPQENRPENRLGNHHPEKVLPDQEYS